MAIGARSTSARAVASCTSRHRAFAGGYAESDQVRNVAPGVSACGVNWYPNRNFRFVIDYERPGTRAGGAKDGASYGRIPTRRPRADGVLAAVAAAARGLPPRSAVPPRVDSWLLSRPVVGLDYLREIAVSRGVDTCAGLRAANGIGQLRPPPQRNRSHVPPPNTLTDRPASPPRRVGSPPPTFPRPARCVDAARVGATRTHRIRLDRFGAFQMLARLARTRWSPTGKSTALQQQYNGASEVREPRYGG